MSQIAEHAARKQEQINAAFLAEVDKIRQAYQAKLKTEVLTAENAGKIELGASLREEFKQAADAAQWLKSFGIDATAGAPAPAPAPAPESP